MAEIDVIPFSSTTEQAEAALKAYLCTQAYLPDAFVDPKSKASNATSYFPMYVFQVSYSANWYASFGFDRQEHYTEYRTETINNVRRTTPVTRTKTVTDWRPANGTAQGKAAFAAYAGNSVPAEAIDLMQGVNLANTVAADISDIDIPVEPFSKSADEVWSHNVKSRLNTVIDLDVQSYRQGDRQSNWKWNADTSHSVSPLLFPMECVQISFENKVYTFWIDGSDASRVRHEKLPRDARKLQAVLIGFLPAAAIILTFLVWWAVWGGEWGLATSGLVLGGGAVGGGLVRKNYIETKSRNALISVAGNLKRLEAQTPENSVHALTER